MRSSARVRARPSRLARAATRFALAGSVEVVVVSFHTPVMQLLANPQTRPVVEKRLPQLAKRLLEDQEAAAFLGSSSPRELAADPHVRGITDEILKALQADLLAAQESQD